MALWMSTKICKNLLHIVIIPEAEAVVDGQVRSEGTPAEEEVVGAPYSYVLEFGASLFSPISISIQTPTSS